MPGSWSGYSVRQLLRELHLDRNLNVLLPQATEQCYWFAAPQHPLLLSKRYVVVKSSTG